MCLCMQMWCLDINQMDLKYMNYMVLGSKDFESITNDGKLLAK